MSGVWKIVGSILAVVIIGGLGFCTVWTVRNWDTVYNSLDGSSVYTIEDIKRTEQETYEKTSKNETEYQKTIAEMRDMITALQVNNAALSDEVATLNLSIASKESEIRQLTSRKNNLESQVESLETTNSDNENTITSLNARIINLNQQISEMIYLSQTYNMQINLLNNRINELTASVDYYENYIATLETGDKAVATFELAGTVWKIEIVTKGTEIVLINPSNTNDYIFNGWKVSGSDELLGDSYPLNSNTKFVADVTYNHTVKFLSNNQVYDTQKVIDNNFAVLPPDPVNDGYDFLGWSLNGVDVIDNVTTIPVMSDITFYAVYSKLHTVSFVLDEQVIETQIVHDGNYVDDSQIIVETDGTFNGWSVDGSIVDLTTYRIFDDTVFVASVSYVFKKEIKFNGLTKLEGKYVWTDGVNYYYSNDNYQYVLNVATRTWSSMTWNGLKTFYGNRTWTDGINYYYSFNSIQYVLNVSTHTWSPMTWKGLTNFDGQKVWTDGDKYYYSDGTNHYVLNSSNHTWSAITWNGLTAFSGADVWTDGNNYYYSEGSKQYVLTISNHTWAEKTGFSSYLYGSNVWTDGVNYYYTYSYKILSSYMYSNAILKNGVWVNAAACGDMIGLNVWTDGVNYYYSDGSKSWILNPKAMKG